jgi:hypothetical protein
MEIRNIIEELESIANRIRDRYRNDPYLGNLEFAMDRFVEHI